MKKKLNVGVVDGARATICVLKGYESIRRNQPVSISSDEYGYSKLGMDQE